MTFQPTETPQVTETPQPTETPQVTDLFSDTDLVSRIKERLPRLFQIAELESSRAGIVGMEVGSARERILIALLIHKFGKANVSTVSIIAAETDAIVFGESISVKTVTGRYLTSVKLIWTVDAIQARSFAEAYVPSCDMMFVQIVWGGVGGLCFFKKETQLKVLETIGRENYIVLPKGGTNPRGVEISSNALKRLIAHQETRCIPIFWRKQTIEFDPYQRWVELWAED